MVALFVKCAAIDVQSDSDLKYKYPKAIPRRNRGRRPENCMWIAEKIKAVSIIPTIGFLVMSTRCFCMIPLKNISSQTAGVSAMANKFSNKMPIPSPDRARIVDSIEFLSACLKYSSSHLSGSGNEYVEFQLVISSIAGIIASMKTITSTK